MSSPTIAGDVDLGEGPSGIVHFRSATVSFVLDLDVAKGRAAVLHWGPPLQGGPERLADLRDTADPSERFISPEEPKRIGLMPTEATAWLGTPALVAHRDGIQASSSLRLSSWTASHDRRDSATVDVHFTDSFGGLQLTVQIRMLSSGLIGVRPKVVAVGSQEQPLEVLSALALLPVPGRATQLLDFTGKWVRERSPQYSEIKHGTHARFVRRGRPGPDSPFLTVLGADAFKNRSGEVWAAHVAWSGDQQWLVECLPEGTGEFPTVLGGGELLRPGEVTLMPGEDYIGPEVLFAYSACGLDGLSESFHAHLRSMPRRFEVQPLTLNTWEAVYFDHNVDVLKSLADLAATIGVERIVLDDGWFHLRRDDDAGLGDWWIDPTVWPNGLEPIVDHVRALGMEFGLWFEPEMVNLDSDVARDHPDWVLGPIDGLGTPARRQYVLDLSHPEAFLRVLNQMSALVDRYRIDFIKWDHNRDLIQAIHRAGPYRGKPAVHRQTTAFYSLLDALRERFPYLSIESCASGGSRVDVGVLSRTERVWGSDTIDPVERLGIQRWTELLLPPELIGSHVGAPRSHTTGRVTDLSTRLGVALLGSAGIEWDLRSATPDELRVLTAWSALYKEVRSIVTRGRRVHADHPDPSVALYGSVSPSQDEAIFVWARTDTSAAVNSGRVRFPGLDLNQLYALRVREEIGLPSLHGEERGPDWYVAAQRGGVTLSGEVLSVAGLTMPTLDPHQLVVFHLRVPVQR